MEKQNQNWNEIGSEIKEIVQDAINSKNYSQLNDTVTKTVRQAIDHVNQGMQNAAVRKEPRKAQNEYVDPDPREQMRKQPRFQGVPHGAIQSPQGERIRFTDRWVNQPVNHQELSGPFARVRGLRTKAYFQILCGGMLGIGFGIGFLVSLAALLFTGTGNVGEVAALTVLAAVSAGCGVLMGRGIRNLGILNRFRSYVFFLKGRPYLELEDLAKQTGKNIAFIRKDIYKMLEYGWFLQGHMDEQKTCLIVTDEAFRQYQATQREYEERRRKEALFSKKEKKLTPEVQAILKEGEEYLQKIHICNERIPGVEISEKISRMELLVKRIFAQVEKQPEAADDLKKMMSYYLPTTVKLLDAYAEMDEQPVKGENIMSSQREIEDTLDTLNQAFEKLLDEIFKDMVWDVSTDISVLHTLLAQEGLTQSKL